MTLHSSMILPLIDAVHRAGARIMADWQKPQMVHEKGDKSPKTDTDDAAEAIVVPTILSLSDLPIIAEEAFEKGLRPSVAPDNSFWLVDALDGTRDFIKGGPDFSVNIALIENGQPVLGVIHAPVTGDTWYAHEGAGAFHLKGGITNVIRMRVPDTGALAMLAGKRAADPVVLEPFIGAHTMAERGQRSSSIKFCLLAQGLWDLYPRLGETYEWDTAAGDAILREAVGVVLDLHTGKPLAYGKADPAFLNTGFVAGHEAVFSGPSASVR